MEEDVVVVLFVTVTVGFLPDALPDLRANDEEVVVVVGFRVED